MIHEDKKYLDADTIKWIAMLAMVLDHTALAFIPTQSIPALIMHSIGKTTGPIMFFFISEGYHHTHNVKKYAERLTAFALISQIPYSLFVNQGHIFPFVGNVILTLLCALLVLCACDHIGKPALKWTVIVLLTAVTYWFDWCFWGVLITLAFHIFSGNQKKQYSAYFVVSMAKVIVNALQYNGSIYYVIPAIISPLLVLGILYCYNGEKRGGKYSKWAFYIFYPVHFLVIYFVYLLSIYR